MKLASTKLESARWNEVFSACDNAFRHADRAGDQRALLAADCAAEAAARVGKPALALPHLRRVFEAYEDRLRHFGSRQRLANNYGVLLIEAGKREQGIAQLEWALETYTGIPYSSTSQAAFTARVAIVRNLARAYYPTASEPIVREWVQEQGSLLAEHVERNAKAPHLLMGAASALDSLSTIGRRQANTSTPAWDRAAAELEPREAEIAASRPELAQACENIALRTTILRACLRELAPPG
jgi:hypothetical protein